MDPIEKAIHETCKQYGLNKEANMAMLRRFHEFNRLAQSAHPEIQAIGQKLVAQNARQVPKPFTPVLTNAGQNLVQKLSAAFEGLLAAGPKLMTPGQLSKSTSAIKKVTGQSALKPAMKGPSGI